MSPTSPRILVVEHQESCPPARVGVAAHGRPLVHRFAEVAGR